jgi:hypothetical protein
MISDGEEKDMAEVGNGAGLYTAELRTHMDVIRLSVLDLNQTERLVLA